MTYRQLYFIELILDNIYIYTHIIYLEDRKKFKYETETVRTKRL